MKNKYIWIFLFALGWSGCKDTERDVDSFDVVEKVVAFDSIYSDKDNPFGMITNAEIFNDVLITKHMNDEYNFSFIDVNEGKLLRRWGQIGDAPDEYIDFGSDFMIVDSQLVFLSKMKKEINYVPIHGILENKDTLNVIKESYPYTVDFRPSRLNIVGKKKFFLGSFKEGRLGGIHSENKILGYFSDYPFDCGEVAGIYRGTVFQSKMKSNDRQKKIAVLTFSSDVFEIYKVTDSGISRIYVSPFKHVPKVWKKGDRYTTNDDESIAGLMNMAVSDDFICFTYSGESYNEVVSRGKGSDEVLCFDWNGKKIKKYILPFPIQELCIDKNYMYGIRNYNDELIIYRFKL